MEEALSPVAGAADGKTPPTSEAFGRYGNYLVLHLRLVAPGNKTIGNLSKPVAPDVPLCELVVKYLQKCVGAGAGVERLAGVRVFENIKEQGAGVELEVEDLELYSASMVANQYGTTLRLDLKDAPPPRANTKTAAVELQRATARRVPEAYQGERFDFKIFNALCELLTSKGLGFDAAGAKIALSALRIRVQSAHELAVGALGVARSRVLTVDER